LSDAGHPQEDAGGGEHAARHRGKLIVIGLLLLGGAAAIGGTLYRWSTRTELVVQLDDPRTRGPAFTKLLRANGLWGLVRRCFLDARPESRGRIFVRVTTEGGDVVRAVRCVVEDESGRAEPAVGVFLDDGSIAELALSAWLLVLIEDGDHDTAAIVTAPAAEPAAVSVRLLASSGATALRVRGILRLETADGPFIAGAAPEAVDLATFRYDGAGKCFRGPAGGPDKAWEVDQAGSTSYCR
jgi:hypothetical protein